LNNNVTRGSVVQRYKRVKTIVNKAVETANLCGIKLNVIVYDEKFHRLKEFYTDNEVRLVSIHRL